LNKNRKEKEMVAGNKKAKRTIYLYLFFSSMEMVSHSFIFAVYVIFLLSHQLNLFQVNLVNVAFFLTILICELPTGAVADIYGRKVSFVLSFFMNSLGLLLYAFSTSFWGFVLAEVIIGVGMTLSSGAFEAWMVDTLKHHNHNGSLGSIFSKEHQLLPLSSLVSALIGGFLADKNMIFPWIAGSVFSFIIGVAAILLIKEEYFARKKFSFANSISSVRGMVASGVNYGIKNKIVRFICLVTAIQYFSTQGVNMQWQPFFAEFLSNNASLGVLYSVIVVVLAWGAYLSAWFLKKMKDMRLALLFSQVIIGAGMALSVVFGSFAVAVSMFLFHEVGRGLFRPLKSAYLNENIPSRERATLISFESMLTQLGRIGGLLFSGLVAELISIRASWLYSGIILLVFTLLVARNNHKNHNKNSRVSS
jgi:MFS family permease